MKRIQTLSIITLATIFTACGGNSSSNSSTSNGGSSASVNTSIVKGTVPGTLIEAFGSDGSYISVKSTQNGTSKHPFKIELSKDIDYHLVMTTNEDDLAKKVVTPIGFVSANNSRTLFKVNNDTIDLGHIDLVLDRDLIKDANHDGVSDDILYLSVQNNELTVVDKANDPTDKDGDGLVNIYEDDDNDGISNKDDTDDDNDGILDINDNDHNNDGVNDNDLDGDGIKNGKDTDIDNDGIDNKNDNDDDNDGKKDNVDNDDDNDGIVDNNDADHSNDNDNDQGNDRDNAENHNNSQDNDNDNNQGNDRDNDNN